MTIDRGRPAIISVSPMQFNKHRVFLCGVSALAVRRRSLQTAVAAVGIVLAAAAGPVLLAQYSSAAEHPAIAYAKATPTDAVARLVAEIDSGKTVLPFDADRGYLPALLNALNIPVSSQGLVFSRTSLQVDRITPW